MQKEIKEIRTFYIKRTKKYCSKNCSYLDEDCYFCMRYNKILKCNQTPLGLGEYEISFIPCKECDELFKDELSKKKQ